MRAVLSPTGDRHDSRRRVLSAVRSFAKFVSPIWNTRFVGGISPLYGRAVPRQLNARIYTETRCLAFLSLELTKSRFLEETPDAKLTEASLARQKKRAEIRRLRNSKHGGAQTERTRNVSADRVEIGLSLSRLEYSPLKLFFLSLLWRFGITTIEQYRGAELGPHAERLRQRLVREH